jgi:hypothetical protein
MITAMVRKSSQRCIAQEICRGKLSFLSHFWLDQLLIDKSLDGAAGSPQNDVEFSGIRGDQSMASVEIRCGVDANGNIDNPNPPLSQLRQ